MSKNVLITGITGFAGSHLAEYYLANEPETIVYGIHRTRSPLDNVKHLLNDNRFRLIKADIVEHESILTIMETIPFDTVHHLAAQSFVPDSWQLGTKTFNVNVNGTYNILASVAKVYQDEFPIVHLAGSSEEYGLVYPNETPITEENPLRPLSPYAVSKIATENLGYQMSKSYGIPVVVSRAFNHSVSKWSPVLVKDNNSGMVDIKYISEIRSRKEKGGDTQVWYLDRDDLSVWTEDGWSKIISLSCHPIRNGKLLKICTRQSVFNVTDNHSILNEKGEETDASKVIKGDLLLHNGLPIEESTYIPKDLAWFYGFFAAEGCITGNSMRVDNKDETLIDKSSIIIKKYLGYDTLKQPKNKNGVFRLIIRKPAKLIKFLKDDFYAKDGNKRIPKIILNASEEIKLEFLKGFNDGDGLKGGYNSDDLFKSFKTVSPILAMGLCFLVENTTKQRYTICVEERGDKFYFAINLNSRFNKTFGNHLKKVSNEIVKIIEYPYDEEVWDFETHNHHFHCGIGRGIVHNSGARRGKDFICSNFAKQIVDQLDNSDIYLSVGNLDAIRDFTDVRDTVRAYYLLVEKMREVGEDYFMCNIATGVGYTGWDVVKTLANIVVRSVDVEKDPERMRPSDVPILIGSYDKLKSYTGWEPNYTLQDILTSLVEYWTNHD